MKRICLIGVVAVLAGCPTRPVPVRVRDTPVTTTSASPGTTESSPTSRPVEKQPDAPAVPKRPVDVPVNPPPDVATMVGDVNAQLQDAFFDYDRSELRLDAIAALRQDYAVLAPVLAQFAQVKVILEGHCDERGSAEYNLALGDQRARRAAELLRRLGLPPERLEVVSYGREAPQCTEPVESCWQRNRRAHVVLRP